mmetsp:Transcript_25571/g.79768  ORF Transcript_25571/g.79768 Transcript_25571/m.79768 type:complete len:224 (+) Transcript_25571:273-944(+)
MAEALQRTWVAALQHAGHGWCLRCCLAGGRPHLPGRARVPAAGDVLPGCHLGRWGPRSGLAEQAGEDAVDPPPRGVRLLAHAELRRVAPAGAWGGRLGLLPRRRRVAAPALGRPGGGPLGPRGPVGVGASGARRFGPGGRRGPQGARAGSVPGGEGGARRPARLGPRRSGGGRIPRRGGRLSASELDLAAPLCAHAAADRGGRPAVWRIQDDAACAAAAGGHQ